MLLNTDSNKISVKVDTFERGLHFLDENKFKQNYYRLCFYSKLTLDSRYIVCICNMQYVRFLWVSYNTQFAKKKKEEKVNKMLQYKDCTVKVLPFLGPF